MALPVTSLTDRLVDVPRDRVAPLVLARDRMVPVPGELGALVPRGGVQRGSVITVAGAPGGGATTVALGLAAAATAIGEWAATVECEAARDGVLGGLAAAEAGVAPERFAVVRQVPRDLWSTVVAALLEGITVVVADVPPWLRAGDARRLVARARERGAVLVARESVNARWPAEATLRLVADGCVWTGVHAGHTLVRQSLQLRVEGRGAPVRSQLGDVLADVG